MVETSVALPSVEQSRDTETASWGQAKLLAFRFAVIYFGLYILPFPFGTDRLFSIEGSGDFLALWGRVVPFLAQHLLNVNIASIIAGDTLFGYATATLFVVLAAVGAVVWSLLQRGPTNHRALFHWLRLYVRLFLGAQMLSYGLGKVLPEQFFPPGTISHLVQPYGDSSLMGILWNFMAASRAYCIFAGLMELVGGTLLFAPRLALLGGLICMGALTNVFALNLAYDVNVKIHSGTLLAMSLFVVAPDAERLLNLLVFNQAAAPVERWDFFARAVLNRGLLLVQLAIGIGALALNANDALRDISEARQERAQTQFYGIWAVQDFSIDGVPVVATPTNDQRWWRVIFDWPDTITVQMATGRERHYWGTVTLDRARQTYRLGPEFGGTDDGSELTYATRESGTLTLSGRFDGHEVHANLRHTDLTFPLLTQRIQLVHERPLNR